MRGARASTAPSRAAGSPATRPRRRRRSCPRSWASSWTARARRRNRRRHPPPSSRSTPDRRGPASCYNDIAGRSLERISALSDGLFAIAMTLIVLEIGVPDPGPIRSEQDLWEAIMSLSPRFVTYLLSFLTLGIFWNGQQTQLHHIARADRSFSWLQLAFLAAIALLPFSTSLLAEFISFRLAFFVYWLNIFAGGALIYACWAYARRAGLVKPEAGPAVSRA